MKVNDPNVSSLVSAEAARSQAAAKAANGSRTAGANGSAATGGSDDVHLSELVRSLRALATDSPERQQHLEQIARSYAAGTYQQDPHAVAGKIITDALTNS